MKTKTLYLVAGVGVVAALSYWYAKANAGVLRTGQPLLALNDALMKINPLTYILGQPTAPLAAGTTPVVTATDTVTGNVLPFPTMNVNA
jgi:hypothetical protein